MTSASRRGPGMPVAPEFRVLWGSSGATTAGGSAHASRATSPPPPTVADVLFRLDALWGPWSELSRGARRLPAAALLRVVVAVPRVFLRQGPTGGLCWWRSRVPRGEPPSALRCPSVRALPPRLGPGGASRALWSQGPGGGVTLPVLAPCSSDAVSGGASRLRAAEARPAFLFPGSCVLSPALPAAVFPAVSRVRV